MLLNRRRGMVLSLAIIILVILLILATAVTTMGTGNLNFALGQMNSERAYQAAEAGLSYAYTDISMATIYASGPQTLPPQKVYAVGPNGDQATVAFFDNRLGTTAQPAGCPVTIPSGFVYLVATGQLKTANRITNEKKVGAMICLGGGGQMSYGVNCESFHINYGVLTAYDLKNAIEVGGYPVAASNTTSLTQGVVDIGATSINPVTIKGDVVLTAGAPASVVQGYHTFVGGSTQNLASPLNFPETKLPVLPLMPAPTSQFLLSALPSGHYTSLDISGTVPLSGRYVIDSLHFSPGGSFHLTTGDTAEVYVQNNLSAIPTTPVFYHTGSSNHLKLYYQGGTSLTLNLDSTSHLSVVAPNADLTLNCKDLTLGAFAAKNVNVVMDSKDSRFCYDPASAQPITTATSTDPIHRRMDVNHSTNGGSSANYQQNDQQNDQQSSSSSDSLESLVPGYKAITVVGRQRF